MSKFRDLLQASFKSRDTEERIDMYFTRPIGLVFALLWNRMGIHPNVITIVSFFLGAGAGWMFHYTDLESNIWGIVLLMLANFCDSTDGQMARLSGKKTLLGRGLDGFSGDVWFFCIYLAIAVRIWNDPIPLIGINWGIWGLLMVIAAGVLGHSPQASLADYYRQIHLWFLNGKNGSELDTSEAQFKIRESLPKSEWFARFFYLNYGNYCKSQEKRTPQFQKFFHELNAKYPNPNDIPQDLRERFLDGSRPLMKYTNWLTYNARAISLYVFALLGVPYVYPLLELTLFQFIYIYMHKRHEHLCLHI